MGAVEASGARVALPTFKRDCSRSDSPARLPTPALAPFPFETHVFSVAARLARFVKERWGVRLAKVGPGHGRRATA